ncbi:MAG TPA: hypothetical protein VJA26_10410 [Gammaproteobacteria bacterium]|nr:hypothetical protein [Gammaproteobacteria bacterium]
MELTRRFQVLGIVGATLAASGCAGAVMTAAGQRLAITSPEFRDYVERVFRQQNQIATELAFAAEDAGEGADGESAELAAAEESLLAACAGLNQLAAARRDEQHLGRLRQAKAARQAPRCEAAIGDARAALDPAGEPAR